MQTLEINTPIQIVVPSEFKIVEAAEYEELKNRDLMGKTWSIKDLQERLQMNHPDTVKEKVLYPFRDELDVSKGGFVRYPKVQGKKWAIQASKMSEWLEKNWNKVYNS